METFKHVKQTGYQIYSCDHLVYKTPCPHLHSRSQGGRGWWKTLSEAPSGTASPYPRRQEPEAGMPGSLVRVDFWGNESPSKQNAIPCASLLPHLGSNVCSLLLNPIHRRTWPSSFRTQLSPLFLLTNTHTISKNASTDPSMTCHRISIWLSFPLVTIEDLCLIISY